MSSIVYLLDATFVADAASMRCDLTGLGPPDVLHQEPYLKFYQPEVVTIAREYQAVVQVSGGDLRVIEEYIERRMARTLERLKARHAVRPLPHLQPHRHFFLTQVFSSIRRWHVGFGTIPVRGKHP